MIDGTDIVYRNFVDISVAVSTPTGLVVPVLRNCQNLGYADVEKVRCISFFINVHLFNRNFKPSQ